MNTDKAIVIAAALICLFCFLVPIWVMSPFKRQGDRELRFALTLLRTGPNITAALALIAAGFALHTWSNWVIVAVDAAILMRINVCELVFRPYSRLVFSDADSVALKPSSMVMSVSVNGGTHAYPIGLIGYHHVVNDVVGDVPVAPSYCSLCHTGIVWNRVVDGRALNFHLIGIRNGNALLTDAETGSIWQQTSGTAIFGPLEGKQLEMIFSDEMTFGLWRSEYPQGKILQPRPMVKRFYFDHGWDNFVAQFPPLIDTADSGIPPREVMVGISTSSGSKAFPLDGVLDAGVIHDRVGDDVVVLIAGPDHTSVRAFRVPAELAAKSAASVWDFSGSAVAGPLTGQQLAPINAVKHFWYDWRRNHPETEVHRPPT